MAKRRRPLRLSREELVRALKVWVLPGLVVAAVAVASGAYALSRLVERARPDLALTFMPSLSPALTAKGDTLILNLNRGNATATMAEIRRLALRSLDGSALNPEALRLIVATDPRG